MSDMKPIPGQKTAEPLAESQEPLANNSAIEIATTGLKMIRRLLQPFAEGIRLRCFAIADQTLAAIESLPDGPKNQNTPSLFAEQLLTLDCASCGKGAHSHLPEPQHRQSAEEMSAEDREIAAYTNAQRLCMQKAEQWAEISRTLYPNASVATKARYLNMIEAFNHMAEEFGRTAIELRRAKERKS